MFVAHFVRKYREWTSSMKNEKDVVSKKQESSEINSSIREEFESATSNLPYIVSGLDKKIALQFYGLFKQAQEGPPDPSDRPSWYESTARFKFDAWVAVSNMSSEEAMGAYCEKMRQVDPSWDPTQKKKIVGWGVRPSTMRVDEDIFDDMIKVDIPVRMETSTEKEWFEAMRNDDVDTMEQILKREPGVLEARDQHLSMTALSRSIDLGCENVAKFLILRGADVNVTDYEGQTPLHFAAQCHRRHLAEVLIMAGADKTARDADGNVPAECCDDANLARLLS